MSFVEWALFVGLGLLWGTSFMWIKIALEDVGPFTLVAWRLLFGVLGMVLVLLFRRVRWPRQARTWLNLAVLGLINNALPFLLISWGELTVDSAVASVINSTVPLFTLIIAHVMLDDDRMTMSRIGGLTLGFLGVLLLMSRDFNAESLTTGLLGQVAILVAALSYGAGGVFARRTLRQVDPVLQAAVPLLVADLAIWPLAYSFEPGSLVPTAGLTWASLMWLGLLGSCVAYLIYFVLLHRVGPTRTTTVTYIVALLGVILGVVILGERLDWRLVLGALIVVSGIALVNRRLPVSG
jgi:drug/metabolite transporter (DMT)-like permease